MPMPIEDLLARSSAELLYLIRVYDDTDRQPPEDLLNLQRALYDVRVSIGQIETTENHRRSIDLNAVLAQIVNILKPKQTTNAELPKIGAILAGEVEFESTNTVFVEGTEDLEANTQEKPDQFAGLSEFLASQRLMALRAISESAAIGSLKKGADFSVAGHMLKLCKEVCEPATYSEVKSIIDGYTNGEHSDALLTAALLYVRRDIEPTLKWLETTLDVIVEREDKTNHAWLLCIVLIRLAQTPEWMLYTEKNNKLWNQIAADPNLVYAVHSAPKDVFLAVCKAIQDNRNGPALLELHKTFYWDRQPDTVAKQGLRLHKETHNLHTYTGFLLTTPGLLRLLCDTNRDSHENAPSGTKEPKILENDVFVKLHDDIQNLVKKIPIDSLVLLFKQGVVCNVDIPYDGFNSFNTACMDHLRTIVQELDSPNTPEATLTAVKDLLQHLNSFWSPLGKERALFRYLYNMLRQQYDLDTPVAQALGLKDYNLCDTLLFACKRQVGNGFDGLLYRPSVQPQDRATLKAE